MQLFRSFISLVILLAHFFVCPQATCFEATESTTAVELRDISVLRDPSGKLSLSDILNPDVTNHFQKLSAEAGQTDFGFTTDAIWLKIPLQRKLSAPATWILEVPYLGLDSISLFGSSGGAQPADRKSLFQRFDAFPIALTDEPQDFYLRVQSQYSISIPLMLWQAPAYSEAKLKDNFTQAIYFGGVLSLAIFNFLLFVSLRDRRYLLYVLFAVFLGLGMFAGNGYGQLLLWPDLPNWNAISQTFFISLAVCFNLLFTQDYLDTRKALPYFHKGLSLCAVFFLFVAIILVLSLILNWENRLVYMFFMAATPISGLLVFLSSLMKMRMGDHSAKYLLAAFGVLWLGGIIASLRALNVIPTNGLTAYSLQIGSAFEILLISFALAYQINTERVLRREAQDLHEQQIQFSSLISHEFRTPLNVIESQAALLEREKANGLDNLAKRTHVIMSAVQHLSHLFTKWSQADRLRNSLSKSNPSSIALYTWLGNLIDRCREFYPTHAIELEVDPDTDTIWADKELLQIALMNLIDNASKYSPAGSVIQVGTILQGETTGLFVEDTGAGIPAENQEVIFNEYIRLEEAVNAPGDGLGLAFVKKIMDLHAGRIELTSQVSIGSRFTLWFTNKSKD